MQDAETARPGVAQEGKRNLMVCIRRQHDQLASAIAESGRRALLSGASYANYHAVQFICTGNLRKANMTTDC